MGTNNKDKKDNTICMAPTYVKEDGELYKDCDSLCDLCGFSSENVNHAYRIKEFIYGFRSCEDVFLNGYCYWFAMILSQRFHGEIYYDCIDNHFVTMINHRLYDVRGDITDDIDINRFKPWNYFLFYDPNLYRSVTRSCILKIE